jgi:hypothetical protein
MTEKPGSESDRNDEDQQQQHLHRTSSRKVVGLYNQRYIHRQEPSVCSTIGG